MPCLPVGFLSVACVLSRPVPCAYNVNAMQAHMRVHIGALSMSRLACSINKVDAICVHTFAASAAKAPTPESGHPVRRRVCLHSVQSRVLLRIYRRVVCMRLSVTILEMEKDRKPSGAREISHTMAP